MRARLGVCGALLTLALALVGAQAASAETVRETYGPLPSELVTIYPPEGVKLAARATTSVSSVPSVPSVLLVHGGGWRQQPNEVEQPWVAQDLRRNGSAVFDINYPQASASETAFPKEPEAIATAVEWVKRHAAEYGGDPNNVVLVGGSAGGHLVNLTGERVPGVRAVVSLSGPTNLLSLLAMARREELKTSLAISLAIALGCGRERYGWEKVLSCEGWNETLAAEYSPVAHVPRTGCPNWLLFSAEEDLVPLSQGQEFLSALHNAGCRASLNVVPGKAHAFGYWWQVKYAVAAFIAAN